MLPFLWFGALALWQTTWRRWKRATLAALAAANMVGFIGLTLSEEGLDRLLEARVVAGFALFAATYAAAVWSAGPTLSPRSTVASVPVETIRVDRKCGAEQPHFMDHSESSGHDTSDMSRRRQ